MCFPFYDSDFIAGCEMLSCHYMTDGFMRAQNVDVCVVKWRVLTAYLRLLLFLPTQMFSPEHFKHLDLHAVISGMEQGAAWVINEAECHVLLL